MKNDYKLKKILDSWGPGQIKTVKALLSMGASRPLIQRYQTSGWIEAIGHGAYKRKNDSSVSIYSALYCIQQELGLPISLYGKSCFEIYGLNQNVSIAQKTIFLNQSTTAKTPSWFLNQSWMKETKILQKKLFDEKEFGQKEMGFVIKDIEGFEVKIPSAERSILEALALAPDKMSFEEALSSVENLFSARGRVLQNLLEKCKSNKTKRFFLYLAEKVNHPWFDSLKLEKIELGSSYQKIYPGNQWNKKYGITVLEDYE